MLASMKSTPKQEAPGSFGPSLHSALSDLFIAGTLREVAAGQFLFRQGDRADRVFLIRKGRLHLRRHLASGHAVTIHAAQEGELFAEGALFAETYHCDAQASEAAVVASCLKEDVRRSLSEAPGLALAWIEHATRQLHAARTLIELRNIRSAEDRIMQHLRVRADAAGKVAVEGTLLDVAGELGLTHEAYYRSLAALERSGRISRERRTVWVSTVVK